MIDTAYIIESADYRIYEACPEILTPDRKPYKRIRTINCLMCGALFAAKSPSAKYCPGCQTTGKSAAKRRAQARLNELIREVESYTKSTLPCEKWSGRKSHADIIRADKQARELGLSYGQFMALRRNGKI